jgi:hypothetical protein
MTAARLTVSHNIKALMDNSVPKVSQALIGDVIDLKQPQVSLRLHGRHPWGIDELEQIAEFFGVEITLLVDTDPNAVYRWLAEHGRIDLRDRPMPNRACNHPYGSNALHLFDPDELPTLIDLREPPVTDMTYEGPIVLLANAS